MTVSLRIGGLVPMFNLQTDEVIFGGVGSGLYGMLLYAIVAVFIAGLMVGRTPEYLGKKIQQKEVKMAMLPILATSFLILVFTAVSIVMPFAKGSYWNSTGPAITNLGNSGPHGFSEMLYAYSSASENNGSAFAGINANSPWFNVTTGLAMQFGRFMFIIPLLAVAGSLAAQKRVPSSSGTFPTHGPLFMGLLAATVLVVGALTFFPALALGPIVEHFFMHAGKLFSFAMFPILELTNDNDFDSSSCDRRFDDAHSEEGGAVPPPLRPRDSPARREGFVWQAESRYADEEPRDFRGGGGRRADHRVPGSRCFHRRAQPGIRAADRSVAVVHGPLCHLRRGHGGSPGQGPGGLAAQDQDRCAGEPRPGKREHRAGPVLEAALPEMW